MKKKIYLFEVLAGVLHRTVGDDDCGKQNSLGCLTEDAIVVVRSIVNCYETPFLTI